MQKREIVYWGIFLLFGIFLASFIVSFASLGAREQTAFDQSQALRRAKQRAETAVLQTTKGDIMIRLDYHAAPSTVANFVALAGNRFYDGTRIHRVVKDLLVQGGDPYSREKDRSLYGTGGPGYVYEDEIGDLPMKYGAVAMANRGKPDTNGSQFFIITKEGGAKELEGKYTIFGEVEYGMDVAERIDETPTDIHDIPLEDIFIASVTLR